MQALLYSTLQQPSRLKLQTVHLDVSGTYSWRSQARQYPPVGAPGIGYFAGRTQQGIVDCLLWRSLRGQLLGVLNHYPTDMGQMEKAGNINIWVSPAAQRRGIATALLTEADARYDIDFEQQRYSSAGLGLAISYLAQRGYSLEELG